MISHAKSCAKHSGSLALRHLHLHFIAHNDLNLGNIAREQASNRYKLLDLDACLELTSKDDRTLRKPGTLAFASPEALRGGTPHSPIENDCFSVGCIFSKPACQMAEQGKPGAAHLAKVMFAVRNLLLRAEKRFRMDAPADQFRQMLEPNTGENLSKFIRIMLQVIRTELAVRGSEGVKHPHSQLFWLSKIGVEPVFCQTN
jgi:serine/threonine protein kinase